MRRHQAFELHELAHDRLLDTQRQHVV
jgi:hypothetical protein